MDTLNKINSKSEKQEQIDNILVIIWKNPGSITSFKQLQKYLFENTDAISIPLFNWKLITADNYLEYGDKNKMLFWEWILSDFSMLSYEEKSEIILEYKLEYKNRLDNILNKSFTNLNVNKETIENLQNLFVSWDISSKSYFKYIKLFNNLSEINSYYHYSILWLRDEIKNLDTDRFIELIDLIDIEKVRYFLDYVENYKVVRYINESDLSFLSFILESKIPAVIHTRLHAEEIFEVFNDCDIDYFIESSHKLKDLPSIFEKLDLQIL